jgi:hypothetical protein
MGFIATALWSKTPSSRPVKTNDKSAGKTIENQAAHRFRRINGNRAAKERETDDG